MSGAAGQDTTATSMLSSPSIQGGRMNADPFGAGIQQRQSQYSQMGYGPGPSNSGYLQTQQIQILNLWWRLAAVIH